MPFSKEPLKEFIEKTPEKKKTKESNEDIIFSLIVSVFLIGIILISGQEPTGFVTFESTTEVIEINTLYNESTNLTLTLKGIPTSLRVTGQFIGNGTGSVSVGQYIVVDKDQLPVSRGISITGFVVFENESNESVEENQTLEINETEITPKITENITENVTITLNITNVTENITVEINQTLNITENITLNVTENITIEPNITNATENVTTNETIAEAALELRKFEEYCLETCFLNDIGNEITLEIILNNVILNLSYVTYTYELIEEEIIEMPPILENITVENVTTNITEINVTVNETLNISINETNITLNISDLNLTNITFNITEFNITNITEINLTNITIELNLTNITVINVTNITIVKNLTEIEKFNLSLFERGLELLDYNERFGSYDLTIGPDKNNFVKVSVNNLSKVDIDFFDLNDTRLKSKVVKIGESIPLVEINLKSNDATHVLRCVQFQEHRIHDNYIKECKNWEITNTLFVVEEGVSYFTINQPGIYVLADLKREEKEFIHSNSVYYMTNCDSCESKYACYADQFCVFQNLMATPGGINEQFGSNEMYVSELVTFIAQLDFDILNLKNSFDKAEVCAYSYYDSGETTINYLKYSPKSYCSDIRDQNASSNVISYEFIDPEPSWKCIDATQIIRESMKNGYSNVFINWLGQDINGETSLYNCYWALTELDRCGGHNPSGANDCRPYLHIIYK